MLDYFLYYFVIPTTIIAGTAGTYYYLNKEKINTMAINTSWEMSKLYLDCLEIKESMKTYLINNGIIKEKRCGYQADTEYSDSESDEVEGVEEKCLVYYNSNESTCFISKTFDEEALNLALETNFDIMFIKTTINEESFYKRTETPLLTDTIYDTFTEKPFIQVEYVTNSDNLSIHNYLSKFYINGNKILDKKFLEWYLTYFYDKVLDTDYTIRIIDKNIKMFDITKEDCIILENDSYKVEKVSKEIKEFSDDESEGNTSEKSNH